MIDDIVCALASHHPLFLMDTDECELHEESGLLRISRLRDLFHAYHKTECGCDWVLSDKVWSAEGEYARLEPHMLMSFPSAFPGQLLRRSLNARISTKPDRPSRTYTLIFGGESTAGTDTDVEEISGVPSTKAIDSSRRSSDKGSSDGKTLVGSYIEIPSLKRNSPDGAVPILEPVDLFLDDSDTPSALNSPERSRYDCLSHVCGSVYEVPDGASRVLPLRHSRFTDFMHTPGILSVPKTHALTAISACITGRKFAVLRRPAGFGISTLASMVYDYYDETGYEGPSWPYNSDLDLDHRHGFLVLHLDFLDVSIDPQDSETFLVYLERRLDAFLTKHRGSLPDVDMGYHGLPFSVQKISHVLARAKLFHGLRGMVVIDNYTSLDSSPSVGPIVQKLNSGLAGQFAVGALSAGVFLGRIGDFTYNSWDSHHKISVFQGVLYDLTYHNALQEALGFTQEDIEDLARAMKFADPKAQTQDICRCLARAGSKSFLFSENIPVERAWGVTFDVPAPSNPNFRPVYPMTAVLRALTKQTGRPYGELTPPCDANASG